MTTTEGRGQPPSPIDMLDQLFQQEEKRKRIVSRLDRLTTYSDTSMANLEKVKDAISEDYTPVFICNHLSHVDLVVLLKATEKLTKNDGRSVRTFRAVVSGTMTTGEQGSDIQKVVYMFGPVYKERGIGKYIPVLTENDMARSHLTPEEKRTAMRDARKAFMEVPVSDEGLIFFPEGTLKGGREREDGSGVVNGMNHATQTGVILFPELWVRTNTGKPIYVPVGIKDSFKILPPVKGPIKMTESVANCVLGDGEVKAVASVAIGEPVTWEAFQSRVGSENKQGQLNYLMGLVADELPIPLRGHYAPKAA